MVRRSKGCSSRVGLDSLVSGSIPPGHVRRAGPPRPVRRGRRPDRVTGSARDRPPYRRPAARVADELRRSIGGLSTAATARMAEDLPWFRELSAEDRSWVGMILQAGIRGFVDWFRGRRRHSGGPAVATSVFGAAPRALAGVITLQQTVDLVKLSIEVVESNVEGILADGRRRRRAPGDLPLRPRGRLRHRRGLRAGRRGARRLGRPARGAGRRRGAARRDRRGRAVAGQRAGLADPRHRLRGARRRPGPPHRDRPLRRGTPRGGRRRHGRAVRGAGRAAGRAARRRRRPPAGGRGRSPTCSATGRWWPARSPPTWPARAVSARAARLGVPRRAGLAGRARARC